MKKNKISVIWGEAVIDAPGKITVKAYDSRIAVNAPKDALGAGQLSGQAHHRRDRRAAARVAGPRADRTGLDLFRGDGRADKMPKSLLVIGSGAIGIEFASFYRTMGAEVTVVEVLPQILPVEDAEIARRRAQAIREAGHENPVRRQGDEARQEGRQRGRHHRRRQGQDRRRSSSIGSSAAVGVVGNIENLGLEKLGVKTDRGTIVIDGMCRTNVPGIYAIGDVAGPPMLAHKAEHEGVICVEAIKGLHPHAMDKLADPRLHLLLPADRLGRAHRTGGEGQEARYPGRALSFIGNGKAVALGEDQGLAKVIFDKKTGQLLGAHLVGPEVTELIQGFVVAMNLETTEEELFHTIFPHPTFRRR